MSMALVMRGVSKRYGDVHALERLDLEVPRGVICGLVGPNGAGKTTTFGVAAGLVRPDSGGVDVLGGGPYDPRRGAGRLGLLPQDSELSPHSPVRVLLRHLAQLQGLSRGGARVEADRVLDAVGLADRADSRVRELSHGMRRRVGLAQALLGSPELLLLDEPTSGLDPDLVVRVRALLRSRRGQATLVVSSHLLAELEATCDFVAFIEAGRCVAAGPLADVTGRSARVSVRLDAPPSASGLAARLPDISFDLDGCVMTVVVPNGEDVAALNRRVLTALLAEGVGVLELSRGSGLEQAWLRRRSLGAP